MGLFSDHGRLFRVSELRSPIRLHSEYRLASVGTLASRLATRTWRAIVGATNDAWIVGSALVLAAAALALEMAVSLKR